MVSLQILNKVLKSGNISFLQDNQLNEEYFPDYQDEYLYIIEHYLKYGKAPDKATMVAAFPNFGVIDVNEPDDYLLNTIREEHLYYETVPLIRAAAELLKKDSNEAVDYLLAGVKNLDIHYGISGEDIAANALKRLEEIHNKINAEKPQYIPTGFTELDEIFNGWDRKEEFVVFLARTGQGKSWVLTKCLGHAWKYGYRAGLISPEMTAIKVGYRVDSLFGHFSNSGLSWANTNRFNLGEYEKYLEKMAGRPGFIVASPDDFQRKITVNKLRNFIKQYDLDILGIDGISYLADQRAKHGDNKTTSLTNISEDIFGLSQECGVPLLTVVQSNRSGINEDDTPDIEHVRDSDGISFNATRIIGLRQIETNLRMGIKKNRYGASGMRLDYEWRIDTGEFNFVPSKSDKSKKAAANKKAKESSAPDEKKDASIQF